MDVPMPWVREAKVGFIVMYGKNVKNWNEQNSDCKLHIYAEIYAGRVVFFLLM
jgi:hypothetical protein